VDVRVERGSGGLGGRPVEDDGDTCRVTGDVYRVRYSRRFGGLGLKTWAEVSRRNGRHVAASRSSRRDEAIS
jgi:hypothetical protein